MVTHYHNGAYMVPLYGNGLLVYMGDSGIIFYIETLALWYHFTNVSFHCTLQVKINGIDIMCNDIAQYKTTPSILTVMHSQKSHMCSF